MLAIAAAVVVVLLLVLVLVLRDEGGDEPSARPSPPAATEVTEAMTEPSPTVTPSPATPDEATVAPSAPAERDPTDSDAAAFAAGYRPPGEQTRSVQADVDGDGRNEVVFASIAGGSSRIDIAAWDGAAYRVVLVDQGGFAERLDGFLVRDFTADRTREIVTIQSVGAQGQSLSVWGHDGRRYARQPAQGGCWDGSHTYGSTGARIEPTRITATCDAPERPLAAQPSDVYEWDGGRWVHVRTLEPGS